MQPSDMAQEDQQMERYVHKWGCDFSLIFGFQLRELNFSLPSWIRGSGAKVEGYPKERSSYVTAASKRPETGSGVWKRHEVNRTRRNGGDT